MATSETPGGVLPLDKPVGPSSHDMVAAVRRALGTRRVGHTGTLDPFASGLLLLCIGPATRIAEYLTGLDKRYSARMMLGRSTDTDDSTGAVLTECDMAGITLEDVERAIAPLRGVVLQRPPAYSAKKVGGERAYAAARAGRELALEPVPVRIDEISVTGFEPPFVDLDIACGSGTYIRAIARDVGASLGVGGHLVALRRTRVGSMDVVGALSFDDLSVAGAAERALIPPLRALDHLPVFQLDAEASEHVRHGRPLRAGSGMAEGVVLLAAGERLIAVAEHVDGRLQPRKVLL
jgi:tRNA pseudouridine55 synthase